MYCKINRWVFAIFFWGGLWGLGCSQKLKTPETVLQSICSNLQKEINDKSICVDSEIGLKAISKKIDLKGKLTRKNIDAISLSRFQSSELVTELDLSDNPHLTSLPNFALDFPSLTHLDISNTNISDWDEDICQLKKLERLIGRNNSYKDDEVPFHTFCLENLKVLDMSGSDIRYIDEYVGKLSHLEELHMAHNQMVIIPLMLSTLPSLKLVDFRENTLKNEDLNTLQSCKSVPKDERENCQEDLVGAIECEFAHELPFQRKKPLRQMYTDLAGMNEDLLSYCDSGDDKSCPHFVKACRDILNEEDRSQCQLNVFESARINSNDLLHRDDCYMAWVGWMVEYESSPQFLENTIRGKTIRELRYASEYQSSQYFFCWRNPVEHIALALPWWKPEKLSAFPFEVFPEQLREKNISSHVEAFFSEVESKYWGIPECAHLPTLRDHVDAIRDTKEDST